MDAAQTTPQIPRPKRNQSSFDTDEFSTFFAYSFFRAFAPLFLPPCSEDPTVFFCLHSLSYQRLTRKLQFVVLPMNCYAALKLTFGAASGVSYRGKAILFPVTLSSNYAKLVFYFGLLMCEKNKINCRGDEHCSRRGVSLTELKLARGTI